MRRPPSLPLPTRGLLASLAFASACAASSAEMEPDLAPRREDATQIITRADILATGANNAWDALRATVRFVVWRAGDAGSPQLATRRGASGLQGPDEVRIMIDGSTVRDVRDLRLISARVIEEIRVLSPLDATTWFGTNSRAGAILIVTR